MDSQSALKKIEAILMTCNSCIAYNAFTHEIEYKQLPLPKNIFNKTLELPHDKNLNPFEWVKKCKQEYKDNNPCILIPGKEFDIFGTRHGYGYGWYDRFLSQTPKKWLRIGVIESSKLFQDKLIKQSWDEPVDWIFSYNQATFSWEIYETFARQK